MTASCITFGSVCSGIEAASEAFLPLGMRCAFVAETDEQASAVLAHHYGCNMPGLPPPANGVPNLGDLETIDGSKWSCLDILIGGTPCQSFSLAGKRKSLDDARGNLALSFVRLAHAVDDVRCAEGKRGLTVLWENVPGVLSTEDNAFGCLLAGFVGCDTPCLSTLERGRWPDAGMVEGPRARAAWRILDAQYFGLAQRRERVLVVISFRDGPDPAAILFEPRGLHGNSAPRRDSGEGVARSLSASTGGSSAKEQQYTFVSGDGKPLNALGPGGRALNPGLPDIAWALQERDAKGADSSTKDGHLIDDQMPMEPVPILEAGARTGKSTDDVRAGLGIGESGDPMFTLQSGKQHAVAAYMPARTLASDGEVDSRFAERDICDALHTGSGSGNKAPLIAFTSKDHGQDAMEEMSPTLRAMNHIDGHANGGGQIAIAFNARQDPDVSGDIAGPLNCSEPQDQAVAFKPSHYTRGKDGAPSDVHPPLSADADKGDQDPIIFQSRIARNGRGQPSDVVPALNGSDAGATSDMRPLLAARYAVRRLMPVECERLQGFKDGHTLVPIKEVSRERLSSPKVNAEGASRYVEIQDRVYLLASDSARYRQLGNSMPVPMIRWVGARIIAAIERTEK